MDYFTQKTFVTRLQQGVDTNVAALFDKKDDGVILHLITQDLVKPTAFLKEPKKRFGNQDLNEKNPVTGKGKALFGLL